MCTHLIKRSKEEQNRGHETGALICKCSSLMSSDMLTLAKSRQSDDIEVSEIKLVEDRLD